MLDFGIPETTLAKEFCNPNKYLLTYDKYWLHRDADEVSSVSIKYDKGIQEELRKIIEKGHPKTSILSQARSVKETVSLHAAHKWMLHVDIESYYKNIEFNHVEPFLKRQSIFDEKDLDILRKFYFSEHGLKKGLCASPMLSEIVGLKIDNTVLGYIHDKHSDKVVYSRYYDDLLFSSNQITDLRDVEERVQYLLNELGFKPNAKKTRIFLLNNAKVLGLRIHDGMITIPKKYKKLLRAKIYSAEKLWLTGESSDWANKDIVNRMHDEICSVLGTLRYVIDNNGGNNEKYERKLRTFSERQAKIDKIIQKFHEDENIFL